LGGWKQGDVDHEVSILIRLGDEDRAGRAPSNVSMMIIRPPQSETKIRKHQTKKNLPPKNKSA
jgi:hypothetical protein